MSAATNRATTRSSRASTKTASDAPRKRRSGRCQMALSPEQLAARGDRVSASFAPYLMAGKTDRIRSEWMKLVGHPAHEEPDWSEMWNIRYGEIIEPLALDFHERKTGHALTRRG